MANIKDLKFDNKNFNKHTEFGMGLLEKSLRENGAGRSILLDKDNNIIAGNGIIEAAGSIGLGGNGYRYQHELCIFSGSINNNHASDVWSYKRSNDGLHPTMKPIALITHAILNIDKVKSVLDLFGGSGSTLIACEQLGRKCYIMELDPHYCDVIRKRYWKFATGSEEGWQDGTKAI